MVGRLSQGRIHPPPHTPQDAETDPHQRNPGIHLDTMRRGGGNTDRVGGAVGLGSSEKQTHPLPHVLYKWGSDSACFCGLVVLRNGRHVRERWSGCNGTPNCPRSDKEGEKTCVFATLRAPQQQMNLRKEPQLQTAHAWSRVMGCLVSPASRVGVGERKGGRGWFHTLQVDFAD